MKNFTLTIALLLCVTSLAQNIITGTVSDENGPLSGATVLLKYTNSGAITDFEGRFEIKVYSSDTLSFSYIGYQTKNILIGDRNLIDVVLEGAIELNEVIICSYGSTSETHTCICTQFCKTSCGFEMSTVKLIDNSSTFQPILFPNPSPNGVFQLALKENHDKVEIIVANITGQTVKTSISNKVEGNLNIDLSDLPSGIYLISIIADGKRLETKKAIRK